MVPFTTIILEPNGDVGICRQKGTEFIFGNLKEQSLEDIWMSPKLQAWREEFISGNIQTCSREAKHMRCHLCPDNNEMLSFMDFSKLDKPKIIKLTANFNGQCNLQCQMCHIWKMPNGLYDELNFWSYARKEIFPHIQEIDMLSGEPLIQQDTYKLIDEMSELNPACQWTITTNAHWKFGDKIKNALERIELRNLIVSIDSFDPDTYHHIRYPGRLDLVLNTLDELITYRDKRAGQGRGFGIHLNFLAQKDNWREIPHALDFCLKKSIKPFVTYLYEPPEYSLDQLNSSGKREVIDFLIGETPKERFYLLQRVLYPLISSLDPLERKQAYLEMMSSES